jgi:glycosyltransferase involved in cell wall biosynthesis
MKHLPLNRMRIAIDTRTLNNKDDWYSFYLLEILKRITAGNATDEFFFIFDRPYHPDISFAKNVSSVITGPAANNPLLLKLWYDIKVPAMLKKYRVDVFVAGPGICSLATKVPQCMLIIDLSFMRFPIFKSGHLFFFRQYIKKFVHKATRIVTVSSYLQNQTISLFNASKEKIVVVHGSGRNNRRLMSHNEIRDQYTSGRNYFLFAGEIDERKNIVSLLKAFSVFKKRQKSDWKIVFAGKVAPQFKDFSKLIASYKYRDDVIILSGANIEEVNKLTAGAYAFVYPASAEGWSTAVYGAVQNRVPVITSQDSAMAEITGDSALLVDPARHLDIAEKMMTLYKDEGFRTRLIEKSDDISAAFTWDKSAVIFMQAIRDAANDQQT